MVRCVCIHREDNCTDAELDGNDTDICLRRGERCLTEVLQPFITLSSKKTIVSTKETMMQSPPHLNPSCPHLLPPRYPHQPLRSQKNTLTSQATNSLFRSPISLASAKPLTHRHFAAFRPLQRSRLQTPLTTTPQPCLPPRTNRSNSI